MRWNAFGAGRFAVYFEEIGRKRIYSASGAWMERDNQWLIGTSEIPVTAYHMGEVLEESELPKKYCGYSACYRREA